jgi:hypothetical protein
MGLFTDPTSIFDSMNQANNMMDNVRRSQMLNQYTRQYPQLLQDQVGMANNGLAASNINLQYLPNNSDIQNKMNQANLQKALITNQYLPQTLQGDLAYKVAMAHYMSNPSMMEKNMTTLGKSYIEPGIVNASLNQLPPSVSSPPNTTPVVNQQFNNGTTSGLAAPASPLVSQQPNPVATGTSATNNQTTNPQDMQAAYAALRQKQTSDATTRQKSDYAVNIQKTMDEMNPDNVQYYSGVEGAAQLKADQAKALAGTTTPQYEKYNNFVKVQVPILADQIRQFYGTSIQPSMYENLQNLINPVSWNTNPQLALSHFNALKELMAKEMATYQDTLNAPIKPFEGGNKANPKDPLGIR